MVERSGYSGVPCAKLSRLGSAAGSVTTAKVAAAGSVVSGQPQRKRSVASTSGRRASGSSQTGVSKSARASRKA